MDAPSLTQHQRGVEAGGPTPHDLVSDQASPSPHLLVQRLLDGTALSCCALGKEILLQQLPSEILVFVPRTGLGVVKYPAAAGPRNHIPPPPPTPKHSEFKCALAAALPPDALSMGREDTEDLGTSLWELVSGGAAWAEEREGTGQIPQVSLNRAGQAYMRGHLSLVPAFPHTNT